jgi:hypothetical protein
LEIHCVVDGATTRTFKRRNGSVRKTVKTLDLSDDEIRRMRGTIIDTKTNRVVQNGSFHPYEFTVSERNKFDETTSLLNHKFEDMDVQNSCEGTIIRVFYHNSWYVSTHNKLDSASSKWGSTTSFKTLFEVGLKEDYDLTLRTLFDSLNLRYRYTFIILADENTRFACVPATEKKVYFLSCSDPVEEANFGLVDKVPRPSQIFRNTDEVFDYVDKMTAPFKYQGLLLIHKNGSQYRVKCEEYAKLYMVRNNEPSIPFRYLQLKCQKDETTAALLKDMFPQHASTIESHEKNINVLKDNLYQEYMLRKDLAGLPQSELVKVGQIDQRFYLFIKNKLLRSSITSVTPDTILDLLLSEEPSNLNQMIQQTKKEKVASNNSQKLVVKIDQVKTPETNNKVDQSSLLMAPRRVKVKYTRIPIDYTCRQKLF